MKALIVGMGIGQLYCDIYARKGWETVCVDPNKAGCVKDLSDVRDTDFQAAHICTPNFLHESQARAAAKLAKLVFVEKPGLMTAQDWQSLVLDNPHCRIAMVKNNQHRAEMSELKATDFSSPVTKINWRNANRVPSPGTWFTDSKRAYGGVSRDLMPHLLSIYMALVGNAYDSEPTGIACYKKWTLADLIAAGTEYGVIDPNGVYDVDDHATMTFTVNHKTYELDASWRTGTDDDRAIHFQGSDHELGLCPEDAYERMIDSALANLDDNIYWQEQTRQDLFIHRMMERLTDAYRSTAGN